MIHFYNILICLLSIVPRLYGMGFSLLLLGASIAIENINYSTLLQLLGFLLLSNMLL